MLDGKDKPTGSATTVIVIASSHCNHDWRRARRLLILSRVLLRVMKLSPRFRTISCLVAIVAACSIILWAETYTWHRVAQIRAAGQPMSDDDMTSLQKMLAWSSILSLAAGALLAGLIYQGIIAPLRRGLEQSKRIIERQEKLSSLGVLAAGVAHEIRNPLTSIKVRLFTQQELLTKGSEASEDNTFITDEISRLEKIVSDFLAFARPSEPEFKAVRASQPLREMKELFRATLARDQIELKEEYLADPQVKADPQQIKQVLINLVQNAAEAIGQSGVVTLRTRTATPRLPGGETLAVLEVEDNGRGIAPEVQQRLFDPFFTTKASGTGLGLSVAARILEKHGGRLEYQTAPGRGTVFRLVLPIMHGESE
jgi:signal transduction histidine kinase